MNDFDRGGLHVSWFATGTVAVFMFVVAGALSAPQLHAQVLGDPVDVSKDFKPLESTYFVADEAVSYDPATGEGTLKWTRYSRQPNLSFNKVDLQFARANSTDFPPEQYDRDPELPFSLTFVSPRTVRLRVSTRAVPLGDGQSLMLAGKVPKDDTWRRDEWDGAITYTSEFGQVRLLKSPWRVEFYDKSGRLLTRTQTLNDPPTFSTPVPFSFVRRATDLGRTTAASFRLAPDEKIFGCGESFTRLNKRGQKLVLYIRDAMGAQSQRMYKPIPFYLSSRGYGIFVHTSTPVTMDCGHDFDQSNVIYTGDEVLDLFVFFGDPKEIVSEYTALTGRSPVPPLWSFGLWMSRITYKSEQEVREVAEKLRSYKIPCDVIHLDTGWFETDWECDYRFAPSRFKDPAKMIADLREQGFHISLWQLPYFTSKNPLFAEAVEKGYFVADQGGRLPSEDGVLDFSNPEAVRWYQAHLAELLKLGVGAIKVDFGEEAPLQGLYASGRTGYYEHNLYPLRYNKAVAELTERTTGEHIIWARSAWAGSQRYPLHWGGDAENTDSAMAATLRAGLSLGLCGFTYWSHDAGGFIQVPSRDLYSRWLALAVLTSHTRCHGAPPREPWAFGEKFVDRFRRTVELKYQLMPYIYAQAVESSQHGYPMLRALFFEFPNDPASWLIEDQYMFGSDLLVAPMFSNAASRQVYLPPGKWYDYQSGTAYEGEKWHEIAAGEVPIVLLVREGAVLPHVAVAQSTSQIDWQNIELRVYPTIGKEVSAPIALPGQELNTVRLLRDSAGKFKVVGKPLGDQVKLRVSQMSAGS
jgi:alpha-D-xyloside xylohydrolase